MSCELLGLVKAIRLGNTAEKAVLSNYAWHHNEDGGLCCPSQETTAREEDLTARGVRKAAARLEAAGWFVALRRKGKRVNRYVLNVDKIREAAATLEEPGSSQMPLSPERGSSKRKEESNQRRESESARANPIRDVIFASGQIVILPPDPPAPEPVAVDAPAPRPAEPPPITVADPAPGGKKVLGNGSVVTGRGDPRPPRAPLRADWQASPEDRTYAHRCGQDPDAMREGFVLWHRGKGVCVADPSGAFRLWCTREAGFQRSVAAKPAKPTFTVRPNGLLAQLMAGGVLA